MEGRREGGAEAETTLGERMEAVQRESGRQ